MGQQEEREEYKWCMIRQNMTTMLHPSEQQRKERDGYWGEGRGVKICYTAGEYLTRTLLGYIGNVMHIKKC